MKQRVAIEHLRAFMLGLQRYRGIAQEALNPDGESGVVDEVLEMLHPWIFGEKCPLPTLAKMLDRVDGGESLIPMDYYNLMTILNFFMPEVKAMASTILALGELEPFPDEVSVQDILAQGWDGEGDPAG